MATINIGGVDYTINDGSRTPYTDIYNAYAKMAQDQYDNQVKVLDEKYEKDKRTANSSFDANARQAYTDYLRQRNSLPEQLRQQGINGGASETAMVNVGNNYALNQGNNSAARGTALAQLEASYQGAKNDLYDAFQNNLMNNYTSLAQAQAQYTDLLNQRDLEQYAATISRYTSTKSVDNAIATLNPSDPNYNAKVQLLQARRAELKTSKKKSSGSSKKSSSKGSSAPSSIGVYNSNKTVSNRWNASAGTKYYGGHAR